MPISQQVQGVLFDLQPFHAVDQGPDLVLSLHAGDPLVQTCGAKRVEIFWRNPRVRSLVEAPT